MGGGGEAGRRNQTGGEKTHLLDGTKHSHLEIAQLSIGAEPLVRRGRTKKGQILRREIV